MCSNSWESIKIIHHNFKKFNIFRYYYKAKQFIWQRKGRVYKGLEDFLKNVTVKDPSIYAAECYNITERMDKVEALQKEAEREKL